MGLTGSLVFFTPSVNADMPRCAKALLEVIRPEKILSVSRGPEDESWRVFRLRELGTDDADDEADDLEYREDEEFMAAGPKATTVAEPEVIRMCSLGPLVVVSLYVNPVATTIKEAVSTMPIAIRGDFLPTSLLIMFGPHDLFDASRPHEAPRYYGRAALSIRCSGQSWPADTRAFEDRVWSLDGLQAAKATLESAVGPLQHAAIWS